MRLFSASGKKIKSKSNLKSRLMSTRIGTKVTVVAAGGTVVEKGGVGVLVNNLHCQIALANPPFKELENTTLAFLFSPFFKNRKAIVFNEASTSIGELIACMRRSVWTVNLPALHQHD